MDFECRMALPYLVIARCSVSTLMDSEAETFWQYLFSSAFRVAPNSSHGNLVRLALSGLLST